MRRQHGAIYEILPAFHVLPKDWDAFQLAVARHPKRIWIRKPLASSRGRGVGVLAAPSNVSKTCKKCLVQQYIRKPYLVNRLKFDLRVYVLVTSFRPLRVYIYPDGLVRFAASEYSYARSTLKNKNVHLTNVSINKLHSGFKAHAADGEGSKWSFTPLFKHLQEQGADVSQLWDQIHRIVALTMLAVEPNMSSQVLSAPVAAICCCEIKRRQAVSGVDVPWANHQML
jgi:tubulin polyglutamylase TTLL4